MTSFKQSSAWYFNICSIFPYSEIIFPKKSTKITTWLTYICLTKTILITYRKKVHCVQSYFSQVSVSRASSLGKPPSVMFSAYSPSKTRLIVAFKIALQVNYMLHRNRGHCILKTKRTSGRALLHWVIRRGSSFLLGWETDFWGRSLGRPHGPMGNDFCQWGWQAQIVPVWRRPTLHFH